MTGVNYTLRAFVDWDNDDDYGDAYEQLPGLMSAQYARGRSKATDAVAAGTCNLVIHNRERVFNKLNSSSPLYGKLLPGRSMYLDVVIDGFPAVRLFTGQTASIGGSSPVGELYRVPIGCADAFDELRFMNLRTDLLENLRVDEVLDEILDAAGSTLTRDFDAATVSLPRAWWYRANTLDALLTAARNSLGGNVFMSAGGEVVFRDYFARALAASHMTIFGGQNAEEELRRDDFVDTVRLLRAGLDVATGNTVLYSLNPVGRVIYPGSDHPDNTWHGQYGVAGKNVIEPVTTTDFVFNSSSDGTGTDKTVQATVSDFTSYGGGFSITWNNLDSAPLYCMKLDIRGQAVRKSNDERTIEVAAASPVISGQEFRREFEFIDDATKLKQFGKWLSATLNSGQTRTTFMVKPKDNFQLYQLATLEFGDRVTMAVDEIDLVGDYFVEKLEPSWPESGAIPPNFRLTLFPADMVGGNFFRISPSSGQGYSTINGTDRIAY